MDKKAEYQAYCDWAFKKEGEAIGRMDGNDAGWAGWQARALLAAGASEGQAGIEYDVAFRDMSPAECCSSCGLTFGESTLLHEIKTGQKQAIHSAEIAALRKERDHWKANHDAQVSRARLLIERPDMPLERVSAYLELAALRERIAGMEKDAGWISVKDRLPEKNTMVLCATEFDGPGDWRIKTGYLQDVPDFNDWYVFGGSWTPSHWMPLPAAPTR